LGLIGFELALFFFGTAVFGPKTAKIGFVLHKKGEFVEESRQM